MHDCPKIQEKILDLVLNEIEPHEQKLLLDEVGSCALCRAELESFEQTLALYDRTAELTQPTTAEWQIYESNLQRRFAGETRSPVSFWQQMFFGTVKVPAPVLAAAALFLCGAAFFAWRPIKSDPPPQFNAETAPATTSAQNPLSILTEVKEPAEKTPEKQTEKIVVREVERVVTRKIYVVKKPNARDQSKTVFRETAAEAPDSSPLNLAEFKPVPPAAPTVIKENKP